MAPADEPASPDEQPPLQPPARPGPGQARGTWAVKLNEACESCHPMAARAWRSSRHRESDTNTAFRAAFAKEPSPFCTACHAPEAQDPRSPAADESALGVGCVSCHVVGRDDDYTVLAAPRVDAGEAPPHRVSRSADFTETGACRNCHQFNFPGRGGDRPQALMQTTMSEHERMAPTRACASCHMPAADGGRDHGFARVRDPAWLRANLEASAELTPTGEVELRLSQPTPGHAYPTGDLFRRLQLGVIWTDAKGRVVGRQTEYLARHFRFTSDHHHGRKLVGDDRVGAGESVIVLEPSTAAPQAHALRWWVTLQRVAEIGSGHDPDAAEIESEVRLHEGRLTLSPR